MSEQDPDKLQRVLKMMMEYVEQIDDRVKAIEERLAVEQEVSP